ncbi:hypothetical protein BKK50_04670 [Rodentibacter rarus]|uniref:Dynamin N-terminal domain-containing protein n=1 Tax=Rodentibacter rarus TaxID=1908260 RepID=A0A1V3IMU7_9PAST|nr:dynamin family protein [Rodentibacter rarus]OOF43487.1 hypothetical protein BKK50_04670 [Rodentibacter rarus]
MRKELQSILTEVDNTSKFKFLFKKSKIVAAIENELEIVDKQLDDIDQRLYFLDQHLENTANELSNTKEKLSQTENNLANTDNELSNTKNKLSQTENELSNTAGKLEKSQEELSLKNNLLLDTEKKLENTSNKLKDSTLREKLVASLIDPNVGLDQAGNFYFKNKTKVAVAGGFSAGKSEFISSLFKDKELKLASSVEPTTAIPTYIINSDKTQLWAKNKFDKLIDLFEIDEEIHHKLTHKFFTEFKINLKSLVSGLCLKTLIPFEYLCFIDTPGYNPANLQGSSTNEDMQTAFDFIKESDALIWVIGLDSNGTMPKSDLDFLRKVLDDSPKMPIYIVLNKADLKPLNIVKEIMDEIQEILKDDELPIAGISAYSSLSRKELAFYKQSKFDFISSLNIRPSQRLLSEIWGGEGRI